MLRPRTLVTFAALLTAVSALPMAAQEPSDRDLLPKAVSGWLFGRNSTPAATVASPARIVVTPNKSMSQRAYCVRLCDGFYFPVTGLRNGDTEQEAELCNTLCPGAKTAVYTRGSENDSIGNALSGTKTYKSLAAAFAYRKSVAPHCSCQKRGVPALALSRDPTLKSGDVVMTETGVRVFRGARMLPYRAQDFVGYRGSKALPSSMLAYLAMIDRPYQNKRLAAERLKMAENDQPEGSKQPQETRVSRDTRERDAPRVAQLNRRLASPRSQAPGFAW
jgi:hypothetical protein